MTFLLDGLPLGLGIHGLLWGWVAYTTDRRQGYLFWAASAFFLIAQVIIWYVLHFGA